jgi:hypothetical protein
MDTSAGSLNLDDAILDKFLADFNPEEFDNDIDAPNLNSTIILDAALTNGESAPELCFEPIYQPTFDNNAAGIVYNPPSINLIANDIFTTHDNIGIRPSYQGRAVMRGSGLDTFFSKVMHPSYEYMYDNETVLNIISSGSDEAIKLLPNLTNQTPTTKAKCDLALESKLFIDSTHYLITQYGMTNIAHIYMRLAVLSDRVCLGCKNTSDKTVCLCGKFRCHHCVRNGRDIDACNGLEQWLKAGSPCRHANNINAPA